MTGQPTVLREVEIGEIAMKWASQGLAQSKCWVNKGYVAALGALEPLVPTVQAALWQPHLCPMPHLVN